MPGSLPESMLSSIDESVLDALFAAENIQHIPDDEIEDSSEVEASPELMVVTHRIAANYIEVLASGAARVLRGDQVEDAVNMILASVGDLERLARASDDTVQLKMLTRLLDALECYEARRQRDCGHARFRDLLRGWLRDFAEYVAPAASQSVRDLVDFDLDEVPVFSLLIELRGMGPRRLSRLYAAGLYTTEAICSASPEDMACVTGLPRELALEVVECVRADAWQQMERDILEMPGALDRFERAWLRGALPSSGRLRVAAETAVRRMQALVARLG